MTWKYVSDADQPIAIDKTLIVAFKDGSVVITHGKSASTTTLS